MSILAFIALLFAAMLAAAFAGAILELLALPLVRALPEEKRNELEGVAFVLAAGGRPMDRFAVARVAPGIGHAIAGFGVVKDLVVFGGLGVMNGLLVIRFLENPERMDWLWYIIAGLNGTPAMPNHKMRQIPLWLRGTALACYVATITISR